MYASGSACLALCNDVQFTKINPENKTLLLPGGDSWSLQLDLQHALGTVLLTVLPLHGPALKALSKVFFFFKSQSCKFQEPSMNHNFDRE